MEIRMADSKDKRKVIKYDNHIHHNKVGECIRNQLVYVLCDEEAIVGILRYSLFWQSIPFLDLLYIDEDYTHMTTDMHRKAAGVVGGFLDEIM